VDGAAGAVFRDIDTSVDSHTDNMQTEKSY